LPAKKVKEKHRLGEHPLRWLKTVRLKLQRPNHMQLNIPTALLSLLGNEGTTPEIKAPVTRGVGHN
jgi:hypothetical protein